MGFQVTQCMPSSDPHAFGLKTRLLWKGDEDGSAGPGQQRPSAGRQITGQSLETSMCHAGELSESADTRPNSLVVPSHCPSRGGYSHGPSRQATPPPSDRSHPFINVKTFIADVPTHVPLCNVGPHRQGKSDKSRHLYSGWARASVLLQTKPPECSHSQNP